MRLNVGSGAVVAPGWVHVDTIGYRPTVRADMGTLPFRSETARMIVASHSLQMVGYLDLVPTLREFCRVLRSGGQVRILAPDIDAAMVNYRAGNIGWFPAIVGDETTIEGRFATYVNWFGTARTIFTAGWLVELCRRAGFTTAIQTRVGETEFGDPSVCELDDRPHESIVVEARK